MNYTYMQALSLAFPTVQAQAHGNGNVYESIEYVGGGAMPTKATLDAWITANPIPAYARAPTLVDDTPSFGYRPLDGLPISAAQICVNFTTASVLGRNFYLGVAGTDGSFICPRNAVVTDVTASIQAAVSGDTYFYVRLLNSVTNLLTITIPSGELSAVLNEQDLLLLRGQAVRVYVSGAKSVTNPIVSCMLSWRN